MLQMVTYLKSFVRTEDGQDLLEYALLIALIAIVCVTAITASGTAVQDAFNDIAAAI